MQGSIPAALCHYQLEVQTKSHVALLASLTQYSCKCLLALKSVSGEYSIDIFFLYISLDCMNIDKIRISST